ncbi:MAG: LysR family transcriptional regulator [Actinomycetota bacterium]
MKLRHLETFLVLADELHFGRTAERLHVAQPAVSQTISALEGELGLKLFDRSNRRVELTAAGAAYRQEVEQVFAQLDRASGAAHAAEAGVRGRLTIAFTAVCTLTFLPDLISRFIDDHPGVAVQLRQLGTAEQIDALRVGAIDVGFSILPNRHAPVHSQLIVDDELHVFLPAGHELAGHDHVATSRALDEPFLLMSREREPCVHETFARMCEQYAKPGRVVLEVDHLESMLAFVGAGMGVSLLPSIAGRLRLDGVESRPLDPPVPSGVSAVWDPAAVSPTTRRFLDRLDAVPFATTG